MNNTVNRIARVCLPGLALASGTVLNASDPQKPNIVYILADDMGFECSGAYGGPYSTPNIDRIAEEGVMFTSAYSQPLSTPSRVESMTGKYNHRNYSEFGHLNHDQKTFGNLAREAGYKTCIAGKWQLGENSGLPGHFGFDNWCLWQLNYGRARNAERYANALIEADGRVLERDADSYGPEIFVSYIEKFIKENKEKPFFVYYPMALVHDPFVVTPDSDDWKKNKDDRYLKDTAYFADMVEYCDKNVGRIVDLLKAEGLYDNTLVIFTGDNGTNKQIYTTMKDGSVIRGGKGTTTDAGTHVAMIATYGNRQGEPRKCDDLIDFTDLLPTFADAMDIKPYGDIDGRSFLPQIRGEKGKPRKWVFCHYDSFFRGAGKPEKDARRYIRNHNYKLYSTGEFYDMKSDPFELNDIKAGHGSPDCEKNRKLLAKELGKFPEWHAGDIPVEKVMYPEFQTRNLKFTDK